MMGMDPWMIGLQQGMQAAPVISSMEKPIAGLAAAFTSLISPVSLVTVGLTAGAAALIQYFAGVSDGQKQRKLLLMSIWHRCNPFPPCGAMPYLTEGICRGTAAHPRCRAAQRSR